MFIREFKTNIMFLMNSTCVLSIRNVIDMFITNSTCVLSIRNIINIFVMEIQNKCYVPNK